MAASDALVSVEEYLSRSGKPACDYIDGVLRPKSMPTWLHGFIQARLVMLIIQHSRQFLTGSEVTCKIRDGKYLVPDVIVQARGHVQSPYPSEPVHLCAEILSSDDRISETLAKCEDYLDWGVEIAWVINPEAKQAWEYRRGRRPIEVPAAGALIADGISIPLAELFADL